MLGRFVKLAPPSSETSTLALLPPPETTKSHTFDPKAAKSTLYCTVSIGTPLIVQVSSVTADDPRSRVLQPRFTTQCSSAST